MIEFKSHSLLISLLLTLPFLNYGVDIGFSLKPYMVACILVFIFYFKDLYHVRFSMEEYLYVVFMIYYLSSALWSSYPEMSIKMVVLQLVNFFCFFIIRFSILSLINKLSVKSFVELFVKLSFYIYLLAFFVYLLSLLKVLGDLGSYEGQVLGALLVDKGIPRFVAFSFDPNIASIFIATPLFLSLSVNRNKTALFFVLLIFITWSRSAIIIITLIFSIHFFRSLLYGKISSVLIIFMCVILLYFFIDILNVDEMIQKRVDGLGRASGRFEAWSNGLAIFNDNIIFGIGIYSFYLWNIRFFGDAHHLHNTYLDVLVEGGIIGLILFSLPIGLLLLRLVFAKSSYFLVNISYLWMFNIAMIGTLTAISHEGFIFNFFLSSLLLIAIRKEKTST